MSPHPLYRFGSLLLGVAMVAGTRGVAQPTFMKMYNHGNSGYAVREVPGGYVVAGGTDYYYNWHWMQLSQPSTTDIHLFKTDLNGTLQWERAIGNPASRTIARWMEPTSDGGFILCGSDSKERLWPPDSNDVALIKTDGSGNISWSRLFDTGKDEVGFSVQETTDGGFIVCGFHDSAPITTTGTTSILLIKTDAQGTTQWAERIPLAIRDLMTGEPFTYVARQTADGGYVLVGTGIGANALGVYVVRTDPVGAVLWARVFDHDNSVLRYSTGLDVIEHTNGDLLIAGSMDKSQPMETNYPYLLRLTSGGSVVDARSFETVPVLPFQSGFSSVWPTSSGGFFFSGMGGYGGFGDQAQLLLTDADLNTIWSRVYTWDGIATMGSRSGRPTSDGGYIFTGKRQFAGTTLMKTDLLGLIPCKTPAALAPLSPSLVTSIRDPVPQAIVVGAPAVFGLTSLAADSSTACPLIPGTLPVELTSFTATVVEGEQVRLDWSTGSETNNDHFTVERSLDGTTFEEVDHLPGSGNSTIELHYSMTDRAPLPVPISYYRLAQVDADGHAERSRVVPVFFAHRGNGALEVRMTPEHTYALFFSDHDGNAELLVHGMDGRLISAALVTISRGANMIALPASSGAHSLCSFTLRNEVMSLSSRFVR